jgi:hypothetical protein
MFAFPVIADTHLTACHIRFVPEADLTVTVWTFPFRNDRRARYCSLALRSNALSTASVIAVTPVWIVGFGTGANSGEWLSGSGGPHLREAATRSGS